MARSNFYAHFPDKTQLLLTLVRKLSLEAYDAHAGWSPAAETALADLVDGSVAVMTCYRENARVLAAALEVAGYDGDVCGLWAVGRADRRLPRPRPCLAGVRARRWTRSGAARSRGRCPRRRRRRDAHDRGPRRQR